MRNPGSDTPPNGPRPAPAPAQSDDSALMAELYQDLASLPIEVSRKWEARLRGAAQSRPAVDVFEAYRTWPVGLRAKLSMQDLRQMSSWVAPGATCKDGLQVQTAASMGIVLEPVSWQYRVTAGPQTGWSLWNEGRGEKFEKDYTVERRQLFSVTYADSKSLGSLVQAFYDAAAKGFHISEASGLDGKYWHVSKFKTLADLHAFEDARRVLLLAERDRREQCATCNDNGRIGGPSFYAPDEGGVPCPDCAPKAIDFDVVSFVRDCCETDPADPENTDTLCIKIGDLTEVVLRHVMPLVKS